MFFCLLYAVNGGSLKASTSIVFWLHMDLQCFNWMEGIEGSLGSQVTASTGLLVCLFVAAVLFLSASFLGIDLAFEIADW